MNFDFEKYNFPFDHYIVENFLPEDVAHSITNEFMDYESDNWFVYNNQIENKKALQTWGKFSKETYKLFQYFCSPQFVKVIKDITGIHNLYPDYGLHGGGWHMHGKSGNLAMHLDYSIHPKLNLQRKLNLIVYLEEDYDPAWGGSLQFWSHNEEMKKPLKKVKEIEPIFNRAILFDTTQHSWHGFPEPINPPHGKMRKSFAVYYMTDITETAEERYRARYVGV